jgi:hypothetical protein
MRFKTRGFLSPPNVRGRGPLATEVCSRLAACSLRSWTRRAPASGSLPTRCAVALLLSAALQPTVMPLANTAAAPQNIESTLPQSAPQDELRKTASWQWPDVSLYEEQLLSYLEQKSSPTDLQSQVQAYWQSTRSADRGPALLERLLDVGGMIEPRIAELNGRLRSSSTPPVIPKELTWLTSDVPGWLQDAIRLACGRALAQRRLYDESLETLAGLEVSTICDPASLLFYRAAAAHHLLKKEECLSDVRLLLQRDEELPSRYTKLAQLMLADMEPLKQDSLDEIARLMQDVERRLDLGRAGTRVRDEEQQIVDKLDKLIEKIEEQMQQMQQQQQQQQSGSPSPAQIQPMQDSQIAGGQGPGDIDNRDNGDRSGWGNLPPAQRQESLQRLTEELPSHYREVIEGYFRQLAKEKR